MNQGRGAHRSDVKVVNPKMHSVFLNMRPGAPLSDSLRTRIVHALVERYPAIE